ncbi:hypothetical protein PMAYCL1PPCAC_30380, partial [Pristionchus mayeri]
MNLRSPLLSCITALIYFLGRGGCSEDEERLMVDIFRGYNPLIPPVPNASSLPIVVRVSLQLVLLIDVNEKDQVMHTNVWLTLVWHDYQMRWNPTNYGEIKQIRVSPDKVWLPDIVLFNNADGNFEVSFMCNVVIDSTGDMLWVPPALYKSSCIIDVEYFPFDQQSCYLIFGSWTYDEKELILDYVKYIDLGEYSKSSIWDIVDAPAELAQQRSRIQFNVIIRRKTLFYTVVLIIPTVLMAFLSMAVFFLPTDSGEKITLTISVLLSIVVFLLLVSKILPPTSSTIPLMAKYLLLTFVLNVITILVTVIIINVYFRSPTTHRMPNWVRVVFLQIMPKFLCMRRPKATEKRKTKLKNTKKMTALLPGIGNFSTNLAPHHPLCPSADEKSEAIDASKLSPFIIPRDPTTSMFYPLSAQAIDAIDAIEYITEYIRKDEELKMFRDDWKYVAMILDRLLLYVFFGITLGGTIGILASSPYVFSS